MCGVFVFLLYFASRVQYKYILYVHTNNNNHLFYSIP